MHIKKVKFSVKATFVTFYGYYTISNRRVLRLILTIVERSRFSRLVIHFLNLLFPLMQVVPVRGLTVRLTGYFEKTVNRTVIAVFCI